MFHLKEWKNCAFNGKILLMLLLESHLFLDVFQLNRVHISEIVNTPHSKNVIYRTEVSPYCIWQSYIDYTTERTSGKCIPKSIKHCCSQKGSWFSLVNGLQVEVWRGSQLKQSSQIRKIPYCAKWPKKCLRHGVCILIPLRKERYCYSLIVFMS